jgi:hypothetical protein
MKLKKTLKRGSLKCRVVDREEKYDDSPKTKMEVLKDGKD